MAFTRPQTKSIKGLVPQDGSASEHQWLPPSQCHSTARQASHRRHARSSRHPRRSALQVGLTSRDGDACHVDRSPSATHPDQQGDIHLSCWKCPKRREVTHGHTPWPRVTAFIVQMRAKPCVPQPRCPLGRGLRKMAQNLNESRLFPAGFYKGVCSPASGLPGFPTTG